jgi:hypothetical protein
LKICCVAEIVVSAQQNSSSLWGSLAVVERNMSWNLDLILRTDCMSFSVTRCTPVDSFHWGYLSEHFYAVHHRIIKDLMAGLQAAVTAVDLTC